VTRILVVDDEPDVELIIRQKFRRQIREKQWQFDFARNGVEALEAMRRTPDIDVILTDINMTEMDGLTLLKELREQYRDLSSVVISAYGDMPNIRRAMNEGATDFLTKPIDMADLENTISKSIEVVSQLKDARRSHQEKLEAEAANRAKSRFLADMSHELRTPLNAIILYSELIMEEARDVGALDFVPDLRKIHLAAKHLLTLINDILDFSKIEAGKMMLSLETFPAFEVIHDVAMLLHEAFTRGGNEVVLDVPSDLGEVYADATRVRQCLFNILNNACKFTQNGKITLRARRVVVEGREMLELGVTDTGIGMSAEQASRLFQPFTQAEPSTSKKYGGTGLGLTITRHFCEMMGGGVSVASEEGKGSTFTLHIPVLVVEHELSTAVVG